MDQLHSDKGLEFKIAEESTQRKRFTFSLAKQKVVSFFEPVLGVDPISEFDRETEQAQFKSTEQKTAIERAGGSSEQTALLATLFVNARILADNQEYHLAINLFREILTIDPDSIDAAKRMLDCLCAVENFEEAESCCRKLIKEHGNSELYKVMGDLLYRRGVDQEARDYYFKALNRISHEGEELFEIYKNLGNVAVRVADFDEAEEFYNKAYTLSPRSDVLLVNYGTLAVQQGDHEKAKERFRQALEYNPLSDKAWVGLALINEHKGDLELAWGSLVRAVDCNPKNTTALLLLCRWSFRNQCFDVPIEAIQNYLSQSSFDQALSLMLAKLLLVQRKSSLALLELERLLLWEPGNEEAHQLYMQVRQYLKND